MATTSDTPTDWLGRCRTDPKHQPSLRHNLVTVIYPGFFATMGEASKYAGPDGIPIIRQTKKGSSSTRLSSRLANEDGMAGGETSTANSSEDGFIITHVTCEHSPRLLHNVIPLPEAFEVRQGWSRNPIAWYTAAQLKVQRWFFRTKGDEGVTLHNDLFANNMAGYRDQEACVRRIEEGVRELLDSRGDDGADGREKRKYRRHLVLFGFSRGATTMLYAALKLRPELAQHISMVVLEAPFDTFENLMRDSAWFPSLMVNGFKTLFDYSGNAAYQMPSTTHLDCPIAFVTSDGDTRVPKCCTERCIAQIKERYPHLADRVAHLQLKKSRHPLMPIGDEADRDAYIRFMEGLYDEHCPLYQ